MQEEIFDSLGPITTRSVQNIVPPTSIDVRQGETSPPGEDVCLSRKLRGKDVCLKETGLAKPLKRWEKRASCGQNGVRQGEISIRLGFGIQELVKSSVAGDVPRKTPIQSGETGSSSSQTDPVEGCSLPIKVNFPIRPNTNLLWMESFFFSQIGEKFPKIIF